ncbi:MAG: FecR family protein [Chitinophagaceae bacterium]
MNKPSTKQLLAILAIVPLFLHCSSGENNKASTNTASPQASIPDAVLRLSDGREIRLDSTLGNTIEAEPGCKLEVRNGKLFYVSLPDSGNYLHTLSVSKGNRFGVVLPDSSEVIMNAQTRIVYPVTFKNPNREIKLTGEMFINVHKAGTEPLLIKITPDIYYAAMSGKFNINWYPGSHGFSVSVFEDSIATIPRSAIQPGKQNLRAAYRSAESFIKSLTTEHNQLDGRYRESPLDSMQAIAWIKNRFNFDYMDLPAAMEEIGRWYDVEVEYEGEPPYFDYVETPGRDTPLPALLKLMESAGVKFVLKDNGKRIVVKGGKK